MAMRILDRSCVFDRGDTRRRTGLRPPQTAPTLRLVGTPSQTSSKGSIAARRLIEGCASEIIVLPPYVT